MSLYAVHIKRRYRTNQILAALIVDSRTLEQRYYNSQVLIDMILGNSIQVANLDIEKMSSGEIRLILKGSHNDNGSNYMVSRKNCGNDTMEDNLCIVTNGWNGIYECIYSSRFGEYPSAERIIASVDGIRLYVDQACAENNTGFKFFNAAISDSRHFGELKQLDIVAANPSNVDCFKMQVINEKNKKFKLFNKKAKNKVTQSYFDYGYTCKCNDDTIVTEEIFETVGTQDTIFRKLAIRYGKEAVPVFNMFNEKLNMIAIYGDCGPNVSIANSINRIELNTQYCDSLEYMTINAPNGVTIAKAPWNIKSIIIISKVGAKVEIDTPFMKLSKHPNETLAVTHKCLEKAADKLEIKPEIAENVMIQSMKDTIESKHSNIKVYWRNASSPMISLKVVKGIQLIHDDFYYGSEIYIIGV